MKKILTQIIVISVVLLFVREIQAKELHLTVAPSVYEVISKKNKEITLPYTFVNLGDPDVFNLKIYRLIPNSLKSANTLLPYQQSETGIAFRIDNPTHGLDSPFFLGTKEELAIDLIVNIPTDIDEKDYYFTFVLESAEGGQSAQETEIDLQGGVGSNIYLTVSENASRTIDGKISLFEIPSRYAFSWRGNRYVIMNASEPIPLILQVANTGDNLIKVSGSITLSNIFSYINQEKKPSVTISQTFIPAQTETILLSQEDREGKIGVYTATAAVYINENSKVLYDSAHVIVLPISGIITIGIFLILIVVFIAVMRRRRKAPQDL